jgi:hypothetical protein
MGDTTTANLDFYYDSSFIYIFNTSGINEEEEFAGSSVMVYPNPFDDFAYLYFTDVKPGLECVILLYDVTGRNVERIEATTPYPVKINRPQNCNGLLFYNVMVDGVRTASGKLMLR